MVGTGTCFKNRKNLVIEKQISNYFIFFFTAVLLSITTGTQIKAETRYQPQTARLTGMATPSCQATTNKTLLTISSSFA
jgi:hypothetical protein